MAKAPRPGTRPRPVKAPGPERRTGFRVTFQGETFELDMDNLTPADDAMMIRETGLSLQGFLGRAVFGYGSMAAIVWMAMRANGYRKLTWSTFSKRIFPRITEMAAMVESDELAIELLDPPDETEDSIDAELVRDAGPEDDDAEDPGPLESGGGSVEPSLG